MSSTWETLPPSTGLAAMVANFTPGGMASMPYWALPLVLSGVSSRFSGRPIRRNALGSFSGGSFGGVTAAARPARAP